ncbi:MAG: hypothetical protein MUO85_02740 [candidate division Zixibacteria bacterium]|nr:hypothetical protein [candidate division Zixibacteria bacterium]
MNHSTSRFEKIINYAIVVILLALGIMVLLGVFRRVPGVVGLAIVVWGIVRLCMISVKYQKEKKNEN